jgi:hypothetical protein
MEGALAPNRGLFCSRWPRRLGCSKRHKTRKSEKKYLTKGSTYEIIHVEAIEEDEKCKQMIFY